MRSSALLLLRAAYSFGTSQASQSHRLLSRATNNTIWLAGDSTMAKGGSGYNDSTDGWGQYIYPYVSLPVVNRAIGGRSARSFTDQGHFAEIAEMIKPGDIVVIEFGHNDGSPLYPTGNGTSNGRGDCPGDSNETCLDVYQNQTVNVQTYHTYITAAGKNFTSKGAHVIINSPTPTNPWEFGSYAYSGFGNYTAYAKAAAEAIGKNASYVDHGRACADAFRVLGQFVTDQMFPHDHTHTSVAGANVQARTFVEAVRKDWNGTTGLKQYLTSNWTSIFV